MRLLEVLPLQLELIVPLLPDQIFDVLQDSLILQCLVSLHRRYFLLLHAGQTHCLIRVVHVLLLIVGVDSQYSHFELLLVNFRAQLGNYLVVNFAHISLEMWDHVFRVETPQSLFSMGEFCAFLEQKFVELAEVQ